MIRIERNPTRRQLTVFGLLWLAFFGVFGATSWWKTGSFGQAGVFWAIAVAIPAARPEFGPRCYGSSLWRVLRDFSDRLRAFLCPPGRGILSGVDPDRNRLAIDGLKIRCSDVSIAAPRPIGRRENKRSHRAILQAVLAFSVPGNRSRKELLPMKR